MSNVELLPLPEPAVTHDALGGLYTPLQVRANVEANTEALRAEVERWKSSYNAAIELKGRAFAESDRLAEALRDARKILAVVNGYFDTEEPNPILQADVNEAIEEIDVALHRTAAQENNHA